MKKPQLKVFRSLAASYSVGWKREDVPMVHVFAQAEPGAVFQPSDGHGGPHWPCTVCSQHGYTEEDFHKDMTAIMEDQKRMAN